MRCAARRKIIVGDRVRITGAKSVAHFGRSMPAKVLNIAEYNGEPPVDGKPEYTPNGTYRKAYILLFEDGSGYSGAYRRSEITLEGAH